MPQLQNLVLTDRAAPPVDHTFTPLVVTNNVGETAEITGVPLGESKFTISNRRVNGRLKGKLVLTVPVVQTQTINGISTPVVVRRSTIALEATFDAASTEAERNNALGMLASALLPAKTLVNDSLVKGQGIW